MFNLQDYETVESRLEKWHEKYPDNRIETELIEANDKRFIVFAKLFKTEADPKPCSNAHSIAVMICPAKDNMPEFFMNTKMSSTNAMSQFSNTLDTYPPITFSSNCKTLL